MAKKYKIYEKLLLGLAITADTLAEIYRDGASARRRAWYDELGPFRCSKQYFYTALSRLYKTDYIEKVIKNGKPYLRLTANAKTRLNRDFPLFSLQKKKWDNKWRLVIFDIKEENKRDRERLRSKLKELGFGMMQKAFIYHLMILFMISMSFWKNRNCWGEPMCLPPAMI